MNDDEYGVRVLRSLDVAPPPASRVDLVRAMGSGRQRARRRRTVSIGAAAAVLVASAGTGAALALTAPAAKPKPELPPEPAVPLACTVGTLPMGSAKSAEVRGGDPSGAWLVGTTEPNYGGRSFVLVWRDGKLIASVPPGPGQKPFMSDINASGVAVGANDSSTVPYVYRDGKVNRLRGTGDAVAINNAGVIAGTRIENAREVPQRWSSPDAEPEPMALPAGAAEAKATDIDEDGTITVVADEMRENQQAYLWYADGTVRLITPPPGDNGAKTWFWPGKFRSGWIYGSVSQQVAGSEGPNGGQRTTASYRYDPRTGTFEKLPGELRSPLTFHIGRKLYAFPAPQGSAEDYFVITFVSDDARVAAGGSTSNRANPDYQGRPLIWRCRS
ncbi:hypothetical protein ACQPZX_38770 [Actinoplanes sp. CA-142083]|uniref:hypothetical protein n=1 Tax=Actinoplanes sp. CA-142083 TaxID=3239903 RepID=UPI003D91F109